MQNVVPWLVVISVLIVVILGIYLWRVERVGPNQVLIIYGKRPSGLKTTDLIAAYRIITGGRTFVWPFIERAERLSLEPTRADMRITKALTRDRQHTTLTATVQFMIKADAEGINKAVRRFLSQSETEKASIVMEILESHLRRVLEGTTLAKLESSPTRFAATVLDQASLQMEQMGIEIVSFIIKDTVLTNTDSKTAEPNKK